MSAPLKQAGLTRFMLAITLLLSLASSVSVIVLWNRAQVTQDALQREVATQNRALCLAKADDQRAVLTSKAYLVLHPHGTADFSRAFIMQQIRQNETRLANLADVNCTRAELRH